MDPKELHKTFRAAPWPSTKELEIFLLAADGATPPELAKLLVILGDKTAAAEPSHRLRVTAFKRLAETNADPSLFVPIARALKTADSTTRAALLELLPKVNHVAGHAELVQLLKLPDPGLRRSLVPVLRALGGKVIFDLSSALTREESPGRTEAIDVAAYVGAHHAIPVLEAVLVGGKPEHRLQALKLLADPRVSARHVDEALAAISRLLADPSEGIATQAITSFASICDEAQFHEHLTPAWDAPAQTIVRAVVEAARRFPSPRTLAALERRFRLGPMALRLSILQTLEAIGDDSTLPLLTEALNHKQIQVRTRAADVLTALSLAKKVNLARTLLWLLRSRDVNVRRIAVELAKKVGDPNGELWPALLRFMRDEDWWVRERVTDALVEMAGAQLTRHIVGYLQDASDVVRRYAVEVLLRLKDPMALGALVRVAQGDADWWVRERALEAIGAIGDARAIPYAVDLMNRAPELRLACLDALTALGATNAAAHVATLLGDEDVDVRLAALTCLETIGDTQVTDAVAQSLTDPDHRIRKLAKAVLAKWKVEGSDVEWGTAAGAQSSLDRLLVEMARAEADDLLLAPGRVPWLKRLGKVSPLAGASIMSAEAIDELLAPHLTEAQRGELGHRRDVDFSYEVKTERLRFRANVFHEIAGLAAVFRIVKGQLLTIEELGLPPVVKTFGDLKNGLVLVGGPTGSGKSTTLAAIIDHINRTSARHIVTLEDPIEAIHESKSSLVNQREIGTHTRSFQAALRSVLREDPDVLLVGEMRDLQTISFAVTAAETGHLVFGTLHTVSADTTVDRLINAFPAGQQNQVRSMLAESLRAVACQHLLRRRDRPGRVLAVEIMLNNDAVANMIRKGKTFQLPSLIATGREQGMQSMDSDLRRLLKENVISPDEAYMKANSKKEFEEFVSGQTAPAAPVAAVPAPAASPAPPAPLPRPVAAPGTLPPIARPGPVAGGAPRAAPPVVPVAAPASRGPGTPTK